MTKRGTVVFMLTVVVPADDSIGEDGVDDSDGDIDGDDDVKIVFL